MNSWLHLLSVGVTGVYQPVLPIICRVTLQQFSLRSLCVCVWGVCACACMHVFVHTCTMARVKVRRQLIRGSSPPPHPPQRGSRGWESGVVRAPLLAEPACWLITCLFFQCLCIVCVCCTQRPEECVRSTGTGVMDGGKPPHAGNQTWVLRKSKKHS